MFLTPVNRNTENSKMFLCSGQLFFQTVDKLPSSTVGMNEFTECMQNHGLWGAHIYLYSENRGHLKWSWEKNNNQLQKCSMLDDLRLKNNITTKSSNVKTSKQLAFLVIFVISVHFSPSILWVKSFNPLGSVLKNSPVRSPSYQIPCAGGAGGIILRMPR